jgi:molybdopterin synthase catalytic subunit
VKVLYFAWVRERIGRGDEEIEPPAGVATVGQLMGWLASRGEPYTEAFANPRVVRAAIDRNHVQPDDGRLAEAKPMTVRLQREDFDVADEIAALSRGRSDVGAVVTFTGICRGSDAGEPVAAMTLEHYPGMAEAEIERHVAEAQTKWPLNGVTVIHRYGRLVPGDNIVLVVTAAAHRHEAFAAAEFLMDYLKTRAPLWKREERADGARWVEAKDADGAAAERWTTPRPREAAE